jgi:hypothetical protein
MPATSVREGTVESRVASATDVAERVCDSAWVDSMTQRALAAGTEDMWNKAKARWDPHGSQLFETVAECLEALPEAVRTAIREVAEALARAVGAPKWAAVTIGWAASSVPLPYEAPLQQGAQAIRLVAVGLSVEKGTLGDCACLPTLVQVKANEFVADSLTSDLRAIAGMPG